MACELLEITIAAHGGIRRWDEFAECRGNVRITGEIWATLGGDAAEFADATFVLQTHQQQVTAFPVGDPSFSYNFKPNVLVLEKADGGFVETQYNPRSSFPRTDEQSRWDDFQIAYICSYSLWNVATQPFLFSYPGFSAEEVSDGGEGELRQLVVRVPVNLISHSREITCFVGSDGLMRKQNFTFGVMNIPVTSVFDNYSEVQGIRLPMRRTMYRASDYLRHGDAAPILACIQMSDLSFS